MAKDMLVRAKTLKVQMCSLSPLAVFTTNNLSIQKAGVH